MRCAICDDLYEPRGSWQRTCTPCYVANKRAEELELRNEVARLRSEVQRLRSGNYQQQSKTAADNRGGLDEKFLKQLIMLAHPDRHGNSELATAVTQRLLAMRDR